MRILVAEKDQYGRRLLDQMLRMDGHDVYIAEEGEHALSLMREVKPDVVLMNMFLSLHSESQPAGQISVHCQEEVSPVVFMTSGGCCDVLGAFMAASDESEAVFDRLPLKVKISAMDHIQKLCGALSRCKRASSRSKGRPGAEWRGMLDYA
jgi:CheY-like chemotaxis protein